MSKKIPLDTNLPPVPMAAVQRRPSSQRGLAKILYQILFNAVNDAIVLVDAQTGSFVEVNDKFCQMTGFSREEAKGLSVAALFTGDSPFAATGSPGIYPEGIAGRAAIIRVAGPGPGAAGIGWN